MLSQFIEPNPREIHVWKDHHQERLTAGLPSLSIHEMTWNERA